MYPASLRYVGENLKELLSLPTKAKKVVVFVNPTLDEVKKVLDWGADLIQLHGDETPDFGKKIGFSRVIKAFRIKNEINLEEFNPWEKAYALLLDTYVKGMPGGTGKVFNWSLAKDVIQRGYKVFIAGGITPDNILSALSIVSPYAIDLSSGVEARPGKKDPAKIKALFEKLKGLTNP